MQNGVVLIWKIRVTCKRWYKRALRRMEAAAQVRQAQAAHARRGGGRNRWAQSWRSQRQWEAERRRESTAEAVAGRRREAVEEVRRRHEAEM